MNILIVDDNPTNRKLLKLQLESEGFTTIESADGVEALAALEHHKIDVIISDILMPNMDGYQLCHRIRKMRRFQNLPVIMYTATYTAPADEDLSLKVGADKYLRNPASPQDIAQSIREVISMKNTHKSRRRKQPKELTVMREYSQVLVRKLEERNQELESATKELTRCNEEIQRNLERIRAAHEIDLAITSTLDLQTVLNVLLQKIELFLPIAAATTVRLLNPGTGEIESLACRGLDEKEWKSQQQTSIGGRARMVIETKAPVTVRNLQADPQTYNQTIFASRGLVSYLGVPLIVKDAVLGVLSLYANREHDFTQEEVEFLNTLAGQAAIAIDNAQLFEQTKKQAQALETSNRVKDEFLSVMSHELRTPLSVIMGYTGLVKEGMLGQVNRRQQDALKKVLGRAGEQLNMINDIMQTTQIDSRSVAVERLIVNVNALLESLKEDYALYMVKPGVELVWDYPSEPIEIWSDAAKLKQILQNLINNALKFTEAGTVTVTARIIEEGNRHAATGNRQEEASEILASRPAPHASQWVEFKVADTGVGISKDKLTAIFEKFYQMDSSETRLYGGVGLGLYIVKHFTEIIGGRIIVASEVDKGTTFSVTLPL